MDRGAWWATVYVVKKESDVTEQLTLPLSKVWLRHSAKIFQVYQFIPEQNHCFLIFISLEC